MRIEKSPDILSGLFPFLKTLSVKGKALDELISPYSPPLSYPFWIKRFVGYSVGCRCNEGLGQDGAIDLKKQCQVISCGAGT